MISAGGTQRADFLNSSFRPGGVHKLSVLRQDTRMNQGSNHSVVELPSGVLPQLLVNRLHGQGFSIRSIRQHGIDSIANDNDLRTQGYLITE
jgi:hypothetical protein